VAAALDDLASVEDDDLVGRRGWQVVPMSMEGERIGV
jgi:hypothetical protein